MRTYTFIATDATVERFRDGNTLVLPFNLPHTENRNTRVRVKYMAIRAGVNFNGACLHLRCLTPSMNAFNFDDSHPAMICSGTQASSELAYDPAPAGPFVRNFGFAENGPWLEFASILQTLSVQLWIDDGVEPQNLDYLVADTDSDDVLRLCLVLEVETF
jgi:hypothetical protein